MKKKKYLILFAALTLSTAFLLGGCGLGEPSETEKTALSAEAEKLTDGNIVLHSRWYNEQNGKLASATVTFSQDDKQIAQGTTDENGNLAVCTLPGNTQLKCVVADAAGTVLAESDVIYKISAEYPSITVIPVSEDNEISTIEVPAGQETVNAAVFVTKDKTISHANLSHYKEPAQDAGQTQQQPNGQQDSQKQDSKQQGQSAPSK